MNDKTKAISLMIRNTGAKCTGVSNAIREIKICDISYDIVKNNFYFYESESYYFFKDAHKFSYND